ncbi:SLATT domain-containing protein [Streptococcus sp. 121]|uniref:SLATT domain-containing protein n=1 Tax=Streptococcus sp. 121 TaxID=2797637 RepID=UPI0018F1046A|nr:SLATT domain-containing protein [Streptococcus sp. 121]MBJ6744950.1 SLATT domain-containing protein [Streptococcus sp. 121]
MDYKDFKDRDVSYEINLKAKTITTVRTARVLASERLYSYAKKWEFIFLFMNLISASLLVYSIVIEADSKNSLLISSIFSIYTLFIQSFVSKLNYNERALKFHYHQLDLENFLLANKYLLLDSTGRSDEEKLDEHEKIMKLYQLSLQGIENHSNLDHKKATKRSKKMEKEGGSGFLSNIEQRLIYADFSLDNLFVNIQPFFIAVFVYLYINFR